MQIVEIGSEAESRDGAFDVLLDMRGRIRDLAVSEAIEAAFRSNY